MGLPFLTILRALPSIISSAGGVIASVNARRDSTAVMKVEERLKRLEDDVVSTNRMLAGLAEQMQAMTEELRVHVASSESRARQVTVLMRVSWAALVLALAGLALTIAT